MAKKGNGAKPVRVFKLVPLFREADAKEMDLGHPVVITGSIDEYVIASIPPGMSAQTAQDVTQGVRAALGKPVLLLTHNIEFLALQECGRKEAAEILTRSAEAAASEGPDATTH